MFDFFISIIVLVIVMASVMFVISAYRYLRLSALKKQYDVYLQGLINDNADWRALSQHMTEIKELIEKANIRNPKIPRTEALGLGQVLNHNLSVIDNMGKNDAEVVGLMLDTFDKAIGTFRYRMRQSINPFFWIETIVFLPSVVLRFAGLEQASAVSKFANITGWIIGAVALLFTLPDFYPYRDATSQWLSDIWMSTKEGFGAK